MGGSNWSSNSYNMRSSSFVSMATDDVFHNTKAKKIDNLMSPKDLKFRECRDSDLHPNTLAVIIGLDVTGSMGTIPDHLVRHKLGTLMESLISHKINDAQVLFMAIGDSSPLGYGTKAMTDSFPLQIGQFESGDTELVKWLTSANLEGGGGGQSKESYQLAWLVGGRHTSIDCFEKRGIKGVLFTMGDEGFWETTTGVEQKELFGLPAEDIDSLELLKQAQKMYHVFHIHVQEGTYRDSRQVLDPWKAVLKENLIICEDKDTIPEIISTTVAMVHGIDMNEFVKNFDSKTANAVKGALIHVSNSLSTRPKAQDGVMVL